MILNVDNLPGLTLEYATRLGEQAGYEVKVYDKREEDKKASASQKDKNKTANPQEHRSNRLNICHLDGVVQKASIG
jgi:uncharacterized protein YmfQ (DUF2313 family)